MAHRNSHARREGQRRSLGEVNACQVCVPINNQIHWALSWDVFVLIADLTTNIYPNQSMATPALPGLATRAPQRTATDTRDRRLAVSLLAQYAARRRRVRTRWPLVLSFPLLRFRASLVRGVAPCPLPSSASGGSFAPRCCRVRCFWCEVDGIGEGGWGRAIGHLDEDAGCDVIAACLLEVLTGLCIMPALLFSGWC